MNRREFLKKGGMAVLALPLAGKAVVEVLAEVSPAVSTKGFGLAPAKHESALIEQDYFVVTGTKPQRIIFSGNHPKDMWPGAEQWFSERWDGLPQT